jgi:hypothetical protein
MGLHHGKRPTGNTSTGYPKRNVISPVVLPLGLTDSLYNDSGNKGTSWLTTTIDVTDYVGPNVEARFVCHYVSGTNFRGDFQIGDITLGDTNFTFESNNESFQTTTLDSTEITYDNAVFSSVPDGVSSNRWNRDSAGTGSGSTAITGSGDAGTWYLYTETSGNGFTNKDFWLRSPSVSMANATNLEVIYAAYGIDMGSWNYYLDITAT